MTMRTEFNIVVRAHNKRKNNTTLICAKASFIEIRLIFAHAERTVYILYIRDTFWSMEKLNSNVDKKSLVLFDVQPNYVQGLRRSIVLYSFWTANTQYTCTECRRS